MRENIRNTVVVITGASSGIGRATALEFARRGAAVTLTARREQPLRELASQCEQAGGKALVVLADVTNEAAVLEVARRTTEAFGRIDVWVNNAAVTLFGLFEQTPSEPYRRVIETSVDRLHLQHDRTAYATNGNLFTPLPEGTTASGGWKRAGRSGSCAPRSSDWPPSRRPCWGCCGSARGSLRRGDGALSVSGSPQRHRAVVRLSQEDTLAASTAGRAGGWARGLHEICSGLGCGAGRRL
ncbi:SDR family NAD(P)-dependent oxidoreductase [Sorangium sp. So ce119]|uniref:SDR family NAD(P)-dependent oxidoreductase n=1 Tax=Sorangium sp. So ce119 TaxID=3133279 RepID=UPI003F61633E